MGIVMSLRHLDLSHSLDDPQPRQITCHEFSPGFPETPLSEWTVEELDRFFDGLEALVMYEGEAQ